MKKMRALMLPGATVVHVVHTKVKKHKTTQKIRKMKTNNKNTQPKHKNTKPQHLLTKRHSSSLR